MNSRILAFLHFSTVLLNAEVISENSAKAIDSDIISEGNFQKVAKIRIWRKNLVIPVSMLPLDDSSENLSDMNKKLSEIIEEQTRQSKALAKSMVDIKNGIEVRPFLIFLIMGHFEKKGHFDKDGHFETKAQFKIGFFEK